MLAVNPMPLPLNFSFVWKTRVAGSGHPGRGGERVATLASLRDAGVDSILTLTEEPLDFAPIREFGFEYLHLPIEDFTAPAQDQIDAAVKFLGEQMAAGRGALVHCRAGIGRTGTMLACFLVAQGMEPGRAIAEMRRLRPGSCEVFAQEYAVFQYARRRQGQDPAREAEGR